MFDRYLLPKACLVATLASGCSAQSMPDMAALTKPTTEAFTRLTLWRPWQPPAAETAAAPAPLPAPVVNPPAAPPPRPAIQPAAAVAPPPVAPAANPLPRLRRSPVARPVILPAATTASAGGSPAPVAVRCQTVSAPQGRVRMECLPVD